MLLALMARPSVGQRLGPYEIISLLGSGGMGEVYRARDTTLGRDVAIKILPDAFALDTDRRARFEREARLLAALNHPHIAAIYGFEHRDGVHYLILELVEGETLDQRLRVAALPPVEAMTIAQQIANALAAAHDKGIVHRDLKPSNITITHDGVVKVLDFGLAKAGEADSSSDLAHSPTITVGGTHEGVILGTAAYMSPEQARGKRVDKRTDVWAFGCVLYEMLTGRTAFARETASDTIAAILGHTPALDELPPSTPTCVRRLLRRCLEKDPKRRLHDIADARIEIEEGLEPTPPTDDPTRAAEPTIRGLRIAAWAIGGLVAGALIAFAAVQFTATPPITEITRFTITLPPEVEIDEAMALSPDGRTLVYSGQDKTGRRLYKRTLDSLESVPIRGSDGATVPFFSPDGRTLGFQVERVLKTVPLQGGVATTVIDMGGGGGAPVWLPDNTIVFGGENRGLRQVAVSGGEPRELTTIERTNGELEHRWPVAVPGARAVLFVVHYGGRDSQQVHAVSLDTGKRVQVVQGNGPRILPSGHLVFQRGGSLWVAPFDTSSLTLTGTPTAVIDKVAIALDWSPIVGVSASGSLTYATGDSEPYPPRQLVWVDRFGKEDVIDAPPRSWWWPTISPDGKRLGFHIMDPGNMDAWIYQLDHGPLLRMTYHAFQDGFPLWTPDGRQIVFWSRQGGSAAELYVRSADLTGSDRRLTTGTESYIVPSTWADNGKVLVYQQAHRDTRMDIGVLNLEGDPSPRMLLQSPADEVRPAMSHDGRWIAYQSNATGRAEVYVQPFPELDGRWQVSTQGGLSPIWSPDGRELYYRIGQSVMTVPVSTTGRTFAYGNPKELFHGAYIPEDASVSDARSYALAPDGKRFLMIKEEQPHASSSPARQVVVIVNWAEELKRRSQ